MSQIKLRRVTRCAFFAALLCLCSPIVIPLAGPVPIALQNFAVMLCAVSLCWAEAQLSVLVYLALGLFLPIFSGGNTGLTALAGPTGGYIWSYLLLVPVIRGFRAIPAGGRWLRCAFAMLGCVLAAWLCYLCGTLQFCLLTGRGFLEALSVCVLPFVAFDLLKAAAASLLGVTLAETLQRLGVDRSEKTR